MFKVSLPRKVKFICGFIYSNEEDFSKIKRIMERKYKGIDYESEVIDFDFTDYYTKEMGRNLIRKFLSFKVLINPSALLRIKLYTLKLERKFSYQGKRKVNIDPGYLNDAKLVLATTKDFSHRIYLGKGIYAEVTLSYRKGEFVDFPWTYPDYRTAQYKDIFLRIRSLYLTQIRDVSKK
ncbi:MAG: DUF4416 family protein [Candidatus Omnitrophica bacterium]|nr:DUF4416 family protein [Candidatus Omnitrophota bacterium]